MVLEGRCYLAVRGELPTDLVFGCDNNVVLISRAGNTAAVSEAEMHPKLLDEQRAAGVRHQASYLTAKFRVGIEVDLPPLTSRL